MRAKRHVDPLEPLGFRPRHVMALAAALVVVVVALPAAVQAASTLVNIADPATGSKARVDAGSLRVGGTISARPAAPVTPLWGQKLMSNTNRSDALAGPFGTANRFFITNLTFANVGSAAVQVRVRTLTPTSPSDCSTGTILQDSLKVQVPAGETITVPFPTPLVAPGPCLSVLLFPAPPAGAQVWVTVVGYR